VFGHKRFDPAAIHALWQDHDHVTRRTDPDLQAAGALTDTNGIFKLHSCYYCGPDVLMGGDDMRWLDRISLLTLAIITIPLALAPFVPEPHLWEKIKMLMAGQLTRTIDITDLLMHAAPVVLLLMKLIRIIRQKKFPASSR